MKHQSFFGTQLNDLAVLFQTIQSVCLKLNISTGSTDRTLSGATTAGQSGSGSDGNEEVLNIP